MGDLILIVSGGGDGGGGASEVNGEESETRIATYHQIMINASPFFRAMLQTDGFQEGQELARSGRLELPLPETHAGAMTILCNIFHLATHEVPTASMDSDTLYQISVLVDRYDCARAIRPWPQVWRQQRNVRIAFHDVKGFHDCDKKQKLDQFVKWICVSYQMGFQKDLDKLTSTFNEIIDPDMLDNPALKDVFEKLPLAVLDWFYSQRNDFVTQVNLMFKDVLSGLRTGRGCRESPDKYAEHLDEQSYHRHETRSSECSCLLLGNAIIVLQPDFQLDWEPQQKWTGSLYSMKAIIEDIASELIVPSSINHFRGHEKCSRAQEVRVRVEELYKEAIRELKPRDNAPIVS